MKYINGDLIQLAKDKKYEVIIHGCNCFNTMGAGIAKEIKKNFPEAYEADLLTKEGDSNKIGTYSVGDHKGLKIVNAYTQFKPAKGIDVFDYNGFRKILKEVKNEFHNKKIAMPKIGAGLAGGNWDRIAKIIEEELIGESVDVVLFRE